MNKMISLYKDDINDLEKIFRINLINSCTGFKSANLLGSVGSDGIDNVAIFSSVTHLGSNPPLVGFILRPKTENRNTYDNIIETGFFTINHIHINDVKDAHHTSAKYPKNISEFDKTKLEKILIGEFIAPYVKSSRIKLGCKFVNEYHIKENGTILIVASIEELHIKEGIIKEDGLIRLDVAESVTINGLDVYLKTVMIDRFEYARPNNN